MRRALTALTALSLATAACGGHQSSRALTAPPGACHAREGGALPDPTCTPGAIDPSVTQANIATTICRHGYTAGVRPSSSYTEALKRRQIVAYAYTDTRPRHYEEDHLIALELGGAPRDPANLWPEAPHSPNAKDRVENELHRRVCEGRLTLADAQARILHWPTA